MPSTGAGLKPGRPLLDRTVDEIDAVFNHPAHRHAYRIVFDLIAQLRTAETPADWFEMQQELLAHRIRTDTRRAECSRALTRLARGRSVGPPRQPSTSYGDPDSVDGWQLEAYVFERLSRQLQAVGDGLAWTVFRYDRKVIAAFASNPSPGPIIKTTKPKAPAARGLANEIAEITALWRDHGRFALLHDLTNCLRIGDATEVDRNGEYEIHEYKSNPANTRAKQSHRLTAAINSVIHGYPLPGTELTIVDLDTPYATDLSALNDLCDIAGRRGCVGAKLSGGRALVVTSFAGLLRRFGNNADLAATAFSAARTAAIRRAGIATAAQHVSIKSVDAAARTPLQVPWAIYPIPADAATALIHDNLTFEVVVSADALQHALEQAGICVTPMFSNDNQPLDNEEPVMLVNLPGRTQGRTIHPNLIAAPTLELVPPTTWAQGIKELLHHPNPPADAIIRFKGDNEPWTPNPTSDWASSSWMT